MRSQRLAMEEGFSGTIPAPSQLWNRSPAIWLFGIGAVNLFLLIVSYFRYVIEDARGPVRLLYQFNLTAENNFAAWWSGMLLVAAAVHAFDRHAALRETGSRASTAWVLLAIILVALSADEIGSLHERVRMLGYGDWAPLLPFALVLGAMLCLGLVWLWRGGVEHARVWRIVAGFVCLASVAGHEFLEDRLTWPAALAAWRGVVEEGTELVGMFLLLKVCMSSASGPPVATLALLRRVREPLIATCLALAPLLALATARLDDHDRGHPADWLAATMFLLTALAAAAPWIVRGETLGARRALFLVLALVSSLASVILLPHYTVDSAWGVMSLRMAGLGLVALTLAAMLTARPALRGLTAGIGILAFVPALQTNLVVAYLMPQVVAVMGFTLIRTEDAGESRSTARPDALPSPSGTR